MISKNPIFNFLVGVAGGIAMYWATLPAEPAIVQLLVNVLGVVALTYGWTMTLLYLLFRPSAAWEQRLRDQLRSGESFGAVSLGPWRAQRAQQIADEYGVEYESHPLFG